LLENFLVAEFHPASKNVEHPESNIGPARAGMAIVAPSAEYIAATDAVGVRVLDERRIVRVVGDDRVSFFHGMCSADVKDAAPGTILAALFLTEHAHLIADFFIWVTKDALILDIDETAWARSREHLERLIVADDVEFEESQLNRVIDLEGPHARDASALIASSAASLGEWRFIESDGLLIGNLPRVGGPAFTILASEDRAERIVDQIIGGVPGARKISDDTADILRIENGHARAGIDTTDKTIALEARMNRAISFNKGCYLGQETIERATARGGLKKKLFGLKFTDGRIPERGAAINLDGKEVGRVSSTAVSPRLGAIGLAILHHSSWRPGTAVIVEGGPAIAAQVSELPFKSAN
jgi:tRNA-modifying protein YgfZ